MESVFIQKIFQLTEQLLKHEITSEALMPELENHLKKARQLNFGLHEAETLNTMGVAKQLIGETDTAINHYKMALEKAEALNNADLICKVCNNIMSPLHNKGQTEEAITYANRGIAMVELHQLRTLPALFLYITKAMLLVLIQRYADADETTQKAWELANFIELKNYSRFEFASATFYIHQAWLYISIYNRDEKRYQDYMAYVRSLADQMKSYDSELAMCELIHAIVMIRDADKIQAYEQKLLDIYGGVISLVSLRNLTIFLSHNHEREWAKKYAQQILDRTKDDPQNNAQMIEHAQTILNTPS
jgi:tetratricopeptide (TPR) repeat protein